jgi:hypothetical protein
MALTIKNTFFEIDETPAETPARRRSSSIPHTFKPGGYKDDCTDEASLCDDKCSTSASDKENFDSSHTAGSDTDTQDCFSDCFERTSDFTPLSSASEECGKCKVKLSLADMVGDTGDGNPDIAEKKPEGFQLCNRSKLRLQAQPFQSAREPPNEVKTIIASAVTALKACQDVQNVYVRDGGMGGATMIVANCRSTSPDASWIFPLVKDTLLSSAENSEKTYIMGYNNRPFSNVDSLSFSFSIGSVPTAHMNTACWDTYEKGYCPRGCGCRWDHPTDSDTMKVIVSLQQNVY